MVLPRLCTISRSDFCVRAMVRYMRQAHGALIFIMLLNASVLRHILYGSNGRVPLSEAWNGLKRGRM